MDRWWENANIRNFSVLMLRSALYKGREPEAPNDDLQTSSRKLSHQLAPTNTGARWKLMREARQVGKYALGKQACFSLVKGFEESKCNHLINTCAKDIDSFWILWLPAVTMGALNAHVGDRESICRGHLPSVVERVWSRKYSQMQRFLHKCILDFASVVWHTLEGARMLGRDAEAPGTEMLQHHSFTFFPGPHAHLCTA